jgi:methionine-gamma-lyase
MQENKQAHWDLATLTIHGGHQREAFGALVTPLYQSATFVFDNAEQGGARFAGDETGYIYTRLGNPTTSELERKMALLEGAEDAAACASGMAAVSSALLTHLQAGDHLVASKAVYGCTFALMTTQLSRLGIHATLVDFADLAAVEAAITPQTKVLFCETPVNPHLEVFDLAAMAKIAKKHDLSLAQMALSYVNTRPFLTSTIIGATNLLQLQENIDSIGVILSKECLEEIEKVQNHNPNPAP